MIRHLLAQLLLRLRGDGEPGPRKRLVGSWILRNVPGMLTCAEFEEFVHDYYESAVPEAVRKRFDTHMRICPMCDAHFKSYVREISLGQRVSAEDDALPENMPEELVGAILLAARDERRRPFKGN